VEARELRSIDQVALVIGDCLQRKGAALQRRIDPPAAAISAVMERPEVRPPRLGKLRVTLRRYHVPLCCIRAYCVRKEHADPCGHSPMSTAHREELRAVAVCRTGEVQVDRARREVGVAHEAFDLTQPSGESSQPTLRAQLLLRAGVWRRHTERAKSKHASFVRRMWCRFRSARLLEQATAMSRSAEKRTVASGTAPPDCSSAGTKIASNSIRNCLQLLPSMSASTRA